MYDQFRMEVAIALEEIGLDPTVVLPAIDKVANHYKIEKGDELMPMTSVPKEIGLYFAVKKLEGYSLATLKGKAILFRLFFHYVQKPLAEITPNDIRMFFYTYQEDHHVSLSTLNTYRSSLASLFSWLLNEDYIPKNPMKKIPVFKEEKKQRQALTAIELEKIRSACKDLRELAVIETLYSTGCRVGELVELKRSDINWETKTVRLFGKGKKERYSYLTARAEITLKNYLASRSDDSDWLFISSYAPPKGQEIRALSTRSIQILIRKVAQRTNIDKLVSPHVLRHTTATLAMQRGMPVTDISKLLGHVNLDTTMIYAEVSQLEVQAQHLKCVV